MSISWLVLKIYHFSIVCGYFEFNLYFIRPTKISFRCIGSISHSAINCAWSDTSCWTCKWFFPRIYTDSLWNGHLRYAETLQAICKSLMYKHQLPLSKWIDECQWKYLNVTHWIQIPAYIEHCTFFSEYFQRILNIFLKVNKYVRVEFKTNFNFIKIFANHFPYNPKQFQNHKHGFMENNSISKTNFNIFYSVIWALCIRSKIQCWSFLWHNFHILETSTHTHTNCFMGFRIARAIQITIAFASQILYIL